MEHFCALHMPICSVPYITLTQTTKLLIQITTNCTYCLGAYIFRSFCIQSTVLWNRFLLGAYFCDSRFTLIISLATTSRREQVKDESTDLDSIVFRNWTTSPDICLLAVSIISQILLTNWIWFPVCNVQSIPPGWHSLPKHTHTLTHSLATNNQLNVISLKEHRDRRYELCAI